MPIVLLIQSDLWNMHKHKRLDLSHEPIKAEHNQTHRDEGIASSHVTFLRSRHALQTLLKLNGLRRGERDADSHCNFTYWCRCRTMFQWFIHFLMLFCNICVTLFLYYSFFSKPIFWGGTASLASSDETPLLRYYFFPFQFKNPLFFWKGSSLLIPEGQNEPP